MKVLQPIGITDANLYSSSVAEADYAVWSAATNYAAGSRVIRAATHRIYERLIAGTSATAPESDSLNWLDVGPTNRWAMLDDSPSTVTTATTSLSVYVTPGAVNDIVLMGVIGTQVQIYSGATGSTLVRTVMVPAPVAPATTSTVVITGLSIAAGNRIGIVITGSGTVQCAHMSVGAFITLGQALTGVEVGITDYSVLETDAFGATSVTVRPYSRWISGTYRIAASAVDAVEAMVESLQSSVAWWQVDPAYECTQTLGWLKSHSIAYRGAAYSLASFRLEGLSYNDAVVMAGDVIPAQSTIVLQTARLQLYQRAASAPASPSQGMAYTFSTGVVTGLHGGWQTEIPSGTGPIWVTGTLVSGNSAIAAVAPSAWSAVVLLAQDGAPGATGATGAQGPAGAVNMLWGSQNGQASAGPGVYGTHIAWLRNGAFDPYGLRAGEVLTVSGDVWQDAASQAAAQGASLYLWAQNSAGAWTAAVAAQNASTSAVRTSATITLPAADADCYAIGVAVFHVPSADGYPGTVYVDRGQVERGPVLTQYAPGAQPGATVGAPSGTMVGGQEAGALVAQVAGIANGLPAYSATPPAPTALTAQGAFKAIFLAWTLATYRNHSHCEVWRATSNSTAAAVKVGRSDASLYTDTTAALGTTYWYWVNAVSTDAVVGPLNAVGGTSAGLLQVAGADITSLAIDAGKLADGAVSAAKLAAGAVDATKMASGLEPVTVVASVPGAKVTNAIYNTADSKLYRWTGAAYGKPIGTGDITANEIAANTITAGQIQAGAIGAQQIAAGAITTAKLLVTGSGDTLNADPNTVDASAWTGGTITTGITNIPGGGSSALSSAAGVAIDVLCAEYIPVDQATNYRLEILSRQLTATAASSYLGVAWYDANKALLIANQAQPGGAGDPAGWGNGTYSYFGLVGAMVPTVWTRYGVSFGPAETAKIPSNAKYMRIVGLLNYNNTNGTVQQMTGVRLMTKASADLIVDGAIIASKIAAGAIAVGTAAIANGAINNAMIGTAAIDTAKIADAAITDAKILSLNASKIAAGTIDAARIAASSITADKIDSRGLSIKDASGNVLFSAGIPLGAANITPSAGWLNSNVSIGANGSLSGGGGGQVTIGGLGYLGDLSANRTYIAADGSIAGVSQGAGTYVANSLVGSTNMLWGSQNGQISAGPGVYGAGIGTVKDTTTNPHGLNPGETLTVSADLWCDSACVAAGDSARIYLYTTNAASGWTAAWSVATASTTASRVSVTGTLPTNPDDCVYVAVAIYHTNSPGSGTVFVNRAQLERGPVATLYSPGSQPGANQTYVDGTGALQGVSSGAGTAVQNSLLVPAINSAATTATWSGVSGAGRPADNATVGATLGTDLRNASGTALTSSQVLNNAIDGSVLRVPSPQYGGISSGNAAQGGALKIALPQSWTNTMLRFRVEIYEYSSGAAEIYEIGGYNYQPAAHWYNVGASYTGKPGAARPVYFGHDGAKCCIWIGVQTGTWAYPNARISNLQCGYSNYDEAMWATGWGLSWDASTNIPAVAQDVVANPVPGGAISGIDQITAANAPTYIASAAIGTAHIADAAITNAKIANLDAAKITAGTITTEKISVGAATAAAAMFNNVGSLTTISTATTAPTTGSVTLGSFTSTGAPVTGAGYIQVFCSFACATAIAQVLARVTIYQDGVALYNTGIPLAVPPAIMSSGGTPRYEIMELVPIMTRGNGSGVTAAGAHNYTYRIDATCYSSTYATLSVTGTLGTNGYSILMQENKV